MQEVYSGMLNPNKANNYLQVKSHNAHYLKKTWNMKESYLKLQAECAYSRRIEMHIFFLFNSFLSFQLQWKKNAEKALIMAVKNVETP